MSQTITVQLSEKLYQQLQRTAQLSQTPIEAIIQQGLTHILPPLVEDIPEPFQAEVYPLLQMSVSELQDQIQQTFPASDWATYQQLLEQEERTPQESERLAKLRHQADLLTLRKAYAAVLLKRRNHPIPTSAQLPTAS